MRRVNAAVNERFLWAFEAGNRALQRGDAERARLLYDRAAKENPILWAAIGSKHHHAGDDDMACEHMAAAFRHADDPKVQALCLNDLGMLASKTSRDLAQRLFEQGVALDPRCPELLCNLSLCHKWRGEIEEAERLVDKALLIKPTLHEGWFCKAILELLTGRWLAGWQNYEARFLRGKCRKPDWAEPELPSLAMAHNKRVFLYCEQGAGDTIMMARYAWKLRRLGAHVIMSCQKGLKPLLSTQTLWPVVGEDDPRPEFDYCLPMLSLPRVFQEQFEQTWGSYLDIRGDTHAYTVGLCWAGSADHVDDQFRTITLKQLETLLDLPLEWVSLQKGAHELDLLICEHRNRPAICVAKDYLDTARIIAGLDLVVTVDTSVAHLAGAMGKECWMLTPFSPDWRWGLHEEHTPWYASLRLYRQTKIGDWTTVIERVKQDLQRRYGFKR